MLALMNLLKKTNFEWEGSLAEKFFAKSTQEKFIYEEIGARLIRDKMNNFLWKEKIIYLSVI